MVWASSYDKPEEHPIARIPGKCVPPFQLRSALSKTINEYLCNLNVGSRTSAVRLSGIICTLGIATREVNEIEELIESGMNVACLNFRHGSEDYYRKVIENIQTASKNYDQKIGMHCPISIALKLKGQIIRCFPFGAHTIEITLYENTTVNVSGDLDFVSKDRNPNTLYINYGNIHNVVQVGGGIVIGYKQNEVELVCVAIDGVVLSCRVAKGGDVRSGQCVQLPGAPVNFPLTFHDTKALLFAKEYGIDILFVPYIRSAATVNDIRDFLTSHDINMMVCSQIDNVAGLKNVEEIIKVSDGIVVNRGDLWNEIDQNKSFIPQKSIIAKCNLAGKPVVCTRHFLNSMIKNPRPTRAESCDLANAILDGVDCIMVYHQTAMGEYPSACVQTAAKICKQAEAAVWQRQLIHDLSENSYWYPSELLKNSENHSVRTFFEYGYPPLVEEHLLHTENKEKIVPKFTVMEKDLEKEGNIYISVENIGKFNFRLYGRKHPNFPNYKFHIGLDTIQRCSNSTNCSPLDECYLGHMCVNATKLSANNVFLTWRVTGNQAKIVFQYKERLITCVDFDSLPIYQMVVEGTEAQQISWRRNEKYVYITKPKDFFVVLPSTVTSISMQVFLCPKCKFDVTVTCSTNVTNISIDADFLSNLTFSKNIIAKVWHQIIIEKLPNQNHNKCFMHLDLQVLDNYLHLSFWGISLLEVSDNVIKPTDIFPEECTQLYWKRKSVELENCKSREKTLKNEIEEQEEITKEVTEQPSNYKNFTASQPQPRGEDNLWLYTTIVHIFLVFISVTGHTYYWSRKRKSNNAQRTNDRPLIV